MIKNYKKYLTIILAICFINTAYGQISACQSITPTIWGNGAWITAGASYNFVAESANDAILATGSGDLSVEVYAGSCGGTSLGVFNTVADGEIERIIVGGLVVGQTYSYYISGGTNLMTKVKTYANGRLRDNECPGSFNLLNKIHALREYQMYSNPAVQVTGFTFRFEDVASGDVFVAVRNAVDGHSPQLSTIPGLQAGHTYNVQVKHRVLQIANGAFAQLYSDYGSMCTISIVSGVVNNCVVIPPTMWGVRPWTNVSQGTFVAQSANDAILAKGDGDLTVTVYLGECDQTTSLGAYSTVGAGEIERVVVGDLIAGDTYSYFISGGTNIMSKVKTYADGKLRGDECPGTRALSEKIHALREYQMYSNPAVQVTGFTFKFTDVDDNDEFVAVRNVVDGHSPQLSTIPGLESGHTYNVQVSHRVLQVANGGVAQLNSDFGSVCVLTVTAGQIINDDSAIDLATASNELEIKALVYPNPNSGENVNVSLSNLVDADQMVTIEVMDLFGKKVFSEAYAINGSSMKQELVFNNDLANGLYLVQISSNGQSVTQKLTIN